MTPGPVTGVDVLVGVLFVIGGCLGAAVSVEWARRSRNWLLIVVALGCAGVVAGVVGQRSFPSDDDIARYGGIDNARARASGGLWGASVNVPVINIHANWMALGGFLLALAGLALVLFFEPVPTGETRAAMVTRRLEEDDAV